MMSPEDRDRLVRVEVTLEHVQEGLKDHRTQSEKRSDELKEMIEKLGGKIDANKFKWSSLLNGSTLKTIAYVILSIAAGGGLAGVAQALLK